MRSSDAADTEELGRAMDANNRARALSGPDALARLDAEKPGALASSLAAPFGRRSAWARVIAAAVIAILIIAAVTVAGAGTAAAILTFLVAAPAVTWLGFTESDRQRRRAAQGLTADPYVRVEVLATPTQTGDVTVTGVGYFPVPALRWDRFHFLREELASREFPVDASTQAFELAADWQLEAEQLEHDAQQQWAENAAAARAQLSTTTPIPPSLMPGAATRPTPQR